jgi:hypothetical protein
MQIFDKRLRDLVSIFSAVTSGRIKKDSRIIKSFSPNVAECGLKIMLF